MHIGKTTFFVANQANLDDMPAEKLASLESEYKTIEEANKALLADVKAVTAGGYMRPAKQSRPQHQTFFRFYSCAEYFYFLFFTSPAHVLTLVLQFMPRHVTSPRARESEKHTYGLRTGNPTRGHCQSRTYLNSYAHLVTPFQFPSFSKPCDFVTLIPLVLPTTSRTSFVLMSGGVDLFIGGESHCTPRTTTLGNPTCHSRRPRRFGW